MSIWIFFKIIGSLALLIYGMKVMSEALQKMAGSQLRHILGTMTKNRFTGMLTGMFVTCSVQSSSATTVMTVSFVNAGLLTLAQAISVIMGANIGTTLTAWIMSLGYNVDLTSVVFPAFFIGIILIYSKRQRYIGDFLFGIAFLFFSLVLLSAAGKELDLEHNPAVINFFSSFDTGSHLTIIIFLLIGTIITCIVQSSAAVMAITILLCSTGVLPIYLGIALVMLPWAPTHRPDAPLWLTWCSMSSVWFGCSASSIPLSTQCATLWATTPKPQHLTYHSWPSVCPSSWPLSTRRSMSPTHLP